MFMDGEWGEDGKGILYFVDRAARYKFLVITNSTHFFMYLFNSCLYMFRVSQGSSSGDRIVLLHHLVWLACVSDCLVCLSGGDCSSLLIGIPSSHLHRLITPDDVIIQFDLLMMSVVTLETCRDMKWINTWKKCVKLVITKNGEGTLVTTTGECRLILWLLRIVRVI